MKKKRLVLVLLFLLLTAAGVMLVSPYPRQLVFGPKIQGVPLCAWQEGFRRDRERSEPVGNDWWGKIKAWLKAGSKPLVYWSLSEDDKDTVLLSLVDHSSKRVREAVLECLYGQGSARAAAGVALFFDDPDDSLRFRASLSMRAWRDETKAALPKLKELTRHADPERRRVAAHAIGQIGPHTAETRDFLLAMLKDPHPLVRCTVINGFGDTEWWRKRNARGALPALRLHLKDADASCRVEAAHTIWNIERVQDDVRPVLLAELKNADAIIRRDAAEYLGALAPMHPDVLVGILELIRVDRDEHVLARAAFALRNGGKEVMPLLISLLDHHNDQVKNCAVDALGEIGPAAEAAAPVLLQRGLGLNRKDGPLAKIKAKAIVPGLVALLGDTEYPVEAIQALGEIGPVGKQAIPALEPFLNTNDFLTRQAAAVAVLQIEPTNLSAMACLIGMLESSHELAQSSAAEGVQRLGPVAKPTIPALIKLLSHTFRDQRYFATRALGAIGADAREAVPILLTRLDGRSVGREAVIDALGLIGHNGSKAVPALMHLLGDKELRSQVVQALGRFGAESQQAIPYLVPLLEDDDLDLADAANEALAKIDPARFAKKKAGP